MDSMGNVFAKRGEADKYPLLNAHLDQVDISYDYYYSVYNKYDKWYTDSYTKEATLEYLFDTMTEAEKKQEFTCMHCSNYSCPNRGICGVCEELELNLKGYALMEEIADKWGIDINDADNPILDGVFESSAGSSALKDEVDEEGEITEKLKPYKVYEKGGKLYGQGEDRVLGGDDKCGLFIAFEVARLLPKQPLKILFTVQEEEGCIGIQHFIKENPSWFDDVDYSLTIDRRGGDNLLWTQLGKFSCTKEFAAKLAYIGIISGIPVKVQDGSVADVIYIRTLVKNSINLSAGYYEPHSEKEYVDIGDVKKIVKWVVNIINFQNAINN
jgi:di/tripeptidase